MLLLVRNWCGRTGSTSVLLPTAFLGTAAHVYYVAAADTVHGVAIFLVLAKVMPSLELVDTLAAWERLVHLVICWLPCFQARHAASCEGPSW